MQIRASHIATTDCHMQFNCTHFCVHMIFFLSMLKICMDKNFLDFSLTFLFSKKSLIFLTFLDSLPNSRAFPDFSDQLETLPLLVEIPKVKTHGNSTFFMKTLEISFLFKLMTPRISTSPFLNVPHLFEVFLE